jgi:hypothetical protein
MRTLPLALIAVLALALAGPAAAAPRGKIVNFHAVSTVHSTGGLNFAGSFASSKLGNGTVKYANSGDNDELHSAYTVRLKAGTMKGTATSTATQGGQPTDPTTLLGAGKVAGGTRAYEGVKGTFSLAGATNPDGTLTLKLDGTLELPVTH